MGAMLSAGEALLSAGGVLLSCGVRLLLFQSHFIQIWRPEDRGSLIGEPQLGQKLKLMEGICFLF